MKRILFTLSMPGNNSWDRKWSGAGRNYVRVRKVTEARAASLLDAKGDGYWSYIFGDGWCAGVSACTMRPGERAPKSDGFCGYDWMIDSVLRDGAVYGPTRPKPEAAAEVANG
jgi:hypothetical protein